MKESTPTHSFTIKYQDGRARTGQLNTAHGQIETPAFVPVGTQATVKGLCPDDLKAVGTQIIMCNTYHLYLQPGGEIIASLGGLGAFMGWDGPIMTDSGGFQVMSLGAGMEHGVGKHIDLFADDSRVENIIRQKEKKGQLTTREKFCVVSDDQVIFKSHLDGTLHQWTPEKSVAIQNQLGGDIIFAMDECTSPIHDREYTEMSLTRSHQWEEQSLAAANLSQALYGIIQGGPYEDLRKLSAKFVQENKYFGVGIGGALVDKSTLIQILSWVNEELSGGKPTHLLGIGSIDDILNSVEFGVDTFDCADPTRITRRGDVLLSPDDGGNQKNRWRRKLTSQEYREDSRPIGVACRCPTCSRGFSRAYLRHLLTAQELTAYTLTTIHNLSVMHQLMNEIREAIEENKLAEVKKRWLG